MMCHTDRAALSQDEGEREGLRKRARKMAYEMAAHLRLWMHRVFGFLLTKVFYVLMAGEVYSDHARLEQVRPCT